MIDVKQQLQAQAWLRKTLVRGETVYVALRRRSHTGSTSLWELYINRPENPLVSIGQQAATALGLTWHEGVRTTLDPPSLVGMLARNVLGDVNSLVARQL